MNAPVVVPGAFDASVLIDQIEGNLWMGGCIPGFKLPEEPVFEFVVSLHPSRRYDLPAGCVRLEEPLRDEHELPDMRRVADLARCVNAFRLKGPTLVHCQAGLNRSGLVVGYALILAGRTPDEAIRLIQERRNTDCLCNPVFAAALRRL